MIELITCVGGHVTQQCECECVGGMCDCVCVCVCLCVHPPLIQHTLSELAASCMLGPPQEQSPHQPHSGELDGLHY